MATPHPSRPNTTTATTTNDNFRDLPLTFANFSNDSGFEMVALEPSLLHPNVPVSLYARGLICPEASTAPKTGLTLTLLSTNPNSEAFPLYIFASACLFICLMCFHVTIVFFIPKMRKKNSSLFGSHYSFEVLKS
jgi:hypothetical protein